MKNLIQARLLAVSGILFIATAITGQERTALDGRGASAIHSPIVLMAAGDEGPSLRRIEFGIRYMPTFTAMRFVTSNGDLVDGAVTVSHGAGLMTALNLSNHFGLQGELNYYKVTQTYSDGTNTNKVSLKYVNIPVLLSLNTGKSSPVNLNLVAGPQFGFNVGSDLESSEAGSTDSLKAVVAVRQRDIGLAYGCGLEFALNRDHTVRLDFGYRGFYGLVDMNRAATESDTYNVMVKTARKTNGAYIGLTLVF